MHSTSVHTRIGLIIPSSNRLTEPHMHRYAPEGVQAHVTRLRMTGASHVPLAALLPRIVEATQSLDAMSSVTRAVTATTATAALAALNALELHKLALFSPYISATHQHETAFLAEAGYEVVGGKCLGLHGGDEYITVKPAQWLRLATTNTPAEADGVFLSCTNIHAPEVIVDLERAIAKPVVTSNQAVLWYVLRTLGQDVEVPELGRLFKAQVAEPVGASA
jgi:maleate isomerase